MASLVGVALFGVWGLAGAAGSLFAGFTTLRMTASPRAACIAAALPPLVATGPIAVVSAGALALSFAFQQTRWPWVFFAGVLGLLLPMPLAPLLPAVAGAMLLAAAPMPRAWAGAALALAGWVLTPSDLPLVGLLAVGVGLLARWAAAHPANLTVARRSAQLGLVALPAPAFAGLAFASLGLVPATLEGTWGPLVGVLLAGSVALLAQLGIAALVRSSEPNRFALIVGPWVACTLTLGLFAQLGPRAVLPFLPPLLALGAVAVGLGATFGFRALQARAFGESRATLHRSSARE